MPKRKPARSGDTEPARRPRWRALTAIALLLVTSVPVFLLTVGFSRKAAETSHVLSEGVQLTATLEYLGPTKVANGYHDEMRATYVYDKTRYHANFTCEGCRHDQTVQLWVDPDRPDRWVVEHGDSAAFDHIPRGYFLALSLAVLILPVTALAIWRWRLFVRVMTPYAAR